MAITLLNCRNEAGFCELDGARTERLERHHISYRPEKTIKLCHKCHAKIHFSPAFLTEKELFLLLSRVLSPEVLRRNYNNLRSCFTLWTSNRQNTSRSSFLTSISKEKEKEKEGRANSLEFHPRVLEHST